MEERQEQKSSSSQDSVFYDKRSVISPSSHNPALGHPWSFWVILWVYHLITCWLQWTQVPLSDLGQSCSSWRWGSNLPSLESKISSVQSLSRVRLFVTPWITAHLASLSITNSQSLLKFMSIKSVMPSSHLILCNPFSSCPQFLPASGSFPMSQLFAWGGQSIGASASASVLPMNTQDWSPLGWIPWSKPRTKQVSVSRGLSTPTCMHTQIVIYVILKIYKDHLKPIYEGSPTSHLCPKSTGFCLIHFLLDR